MSRLDRIARNTGLWPFCRYNLGHKQPGKTSMKKQMNSTRYKIDDSADAVYEYSAEREAVREVNK